MAKNKKKLKQRKKRQLRKFFKQASKQTEIVALNKYYPPYEEPVAIRVSESREKQKEDFQKRLDEVYNCTVMPLNNYINDRATLCFKCYACSLNFFAIPSHLIGKEHQRHICNRPFGDRYGERLLVVGSRPKARKQKPNKINGAELVKKLDDLIIQGVNVYKIRKHTGVDIQIIEAYKDQFHSKNNHT